MSIDGGSLTSQRFFMEDGGTLLQKKRNVRIAIPLHVRSKEINNSTVVHPSDVLTSHLIQSY